MSGARCVTRNGSPSIVIAARLEFSLDRD